MLTFEFYIGVKKNEFNYQKHFLFNTCVNELGLVLKL